MKRPTQSFVRRATPRVAALLALLGSACACVAQADAESFDWKLSTSKRGVDLYMRSAAGSEFPRFRATGTACASIETITEYLQDAAHFHDWVPDTVRAEILAEPSTDERIFYLETDMPWPLKNRDMVYRLVKSAGSEARRELTIGMYGVPDYAPRMGDVVRIQSVEGSWHFVEKDGRTRIELEMHMEPGGNIKPWLANRRIGAMVAGMLINLKRTYAGACSERALDQ